MWQRCSFHGNFGRRQADLLVGRWNSIIDSVNESRYTPPGPPATWRPSLILAAEMLNFCGYVITTLFLELWFMTLRIWMEILGHGPSSWNVPCDTFAADSLTEGARRIDFRTESFVHVSRHLKERVDNERSLREREADGGNKKGRPLRVGNG